MATSEIGKWVKRERLKRRMSQGELATAVGKSRTWVSSLENGTFRPRVEDAALLADLFKKQVNEVLATAGYSLAEIAALGPVGQTGNGANSVTLTPDELEAMLERAAERAVRRVLEEGRDA